MLIPIGTEVRPKKPPVGNWILVALNVLIYFVTDFGGQQWLKSYAALNAAIPTVSQYITYQFLHGDAAHLAGNMLFLWIFGNAVCDRMGSFNYTLFYLAGGIFAGMVFTAQNANPLIGASGAIAAVTTAFLVLYPRVQITMLIWFFVVTTFELPAMVLIVFKIILWDNIIAPRLEADLISNVAFSAHLGGYAFGFAVAFFLLLVGALPRNQFDMVALWNRWKRRSGMAPLGVVAARPGRSVQLEEVDSRPLDAAPSPADRLRDEVLDRLYDRDNPGAIRSYEAMLAQRPEALLPEKQQLELANLLAQAQRHGLAARAYERFLSGYPTASDRGQVHLLLGMIYGRYLQRYEEAVSHLREALERVSAPAQRALAESELRTALDRLHAQGGTA